MIKAMVFALGKMVLVLVIAIVALVFVSLPDIRTISGDDDTTTIVYETGHSPVLDLVVFLSIE